MIIGLFCHTEEGDRLFDGPVTRSMDRSEDREELMFSALKVEEGRVALDWDRQRISRVVEKIHHGLTYIHEGITYPSDQVLEMSFSEVNGPSEITTFGPDFTYGPLDQGRFSWEFTFFDSVRFWVRPYRV